MEADSTTYDKSSKDLANELCLPFNPGPENFKLYNKLSENRDDKNLKIQIIANLQEYGLIPETVTCPTNNPECIVVKKTARVIDRVQWVCEGCGKRQPIRTGSFFFRLQCSLLQALQLILAWCEDADLAVVAESFGVKINTATLIYDRLDDLAIKEQLKIIFGGDSSVVLAEVYPDCVNRLSPDTTHQPHVHRILMMTDTQYVPRRYRLTVIKDPKKESDPDNQTINPEVAQIISNATLPNSTILVGNSLSSIEGAESIQEILPFCNVEMQRFITTEVWSQAVSLCAASRDICASACASAGANAGAGAGACASAVQRYLTTSLYRLRHGDGFFNHVLRIIVSDFTEGGAGAN